MQVFRELWINLGARGVQEIVTIQRAAKRLLPIVAIYCVPLFAHPPGSPTDSLEAAVYKSFVKQHTAWAGGCESAVLDSGALPIAEGFQPYTFSRERVKPPKELVALLSQPVSSSASMDLQATGEPFFRVVDHSIIENLFSEEKCTIGDMQQHKCGWLKFKDDFGKACGYWQFSHVTFNPGQTQVWSEQVKLPRIPFHGLCPPMFSDSHLRHQGHREPAYRRCERFESRTV
jgi:hypothetical protein